MRIMFVVNPIVTRVSFPLLASVAHDRSKVKSVYLKAMKMTASVNFPIYAFLAVFGPEVVAIVLGPKWVASAPIMRILAIWCAVRSVGNPVGSLLFATGETKRAIYSALGVAIAVFVFVYIGAPWGILGIPVALTVLYAIPDPGLLGDAGTAGVRRRFLRISSCSAAACAHHNLRRPRRRRRAPGDRRSAGAPGDRRRGWRVGLHCKQLVHQPRMAFVDGGTVDEGQPAAPRKHQLETFVPEKWKVPIFGKKRRDTKKLEHRNRFRNRVRYCSAVRTPSSLNQTDLAPRVLRRP